MTLIYYCYLGEPSTKLSQSLESSLSSHYVTSGELVTSPLAPQAGSVHSLPPDLLANTLDLKRTLRRWSQDKEQVGGILGYHLKSLAKAAKGLFIRSHLAGTR